MRMRKRGGFGAVAAVAAVGLVVAGCGKSTPTSSSHSGGASASHKFLGCMVTDTGGIDDRSFNASSWQGMQEAMNADPSKVTVKYLQSTSSADYVPNITSFIHEHCGIIVTVGFLMGPDTQTAAKANPSQKFAIVDYSYSPPVPNIDALVFDTVQDGFLGGYLAAGMTKTGKVATYGGIKLPTVTIYMDGFWDGVQYYNQKNHKHVQVLGWNEQTQNGSFVGNFTSTSDGAALTTSFLQKGADIVFPVAGNVGLGTAAVVATADKGGAHDAVIWVDTDGCVSAPQYCPYFLTSVEKGIQSAVKTAVLSAANGSFKGGNYIGTLANGGVTLAPFHDWASKVPASLQQQLVTIGEGIASGAIKTPTKSPV